ncbi:hypothetical protein D9M69_617170 [compost metagenome]
MSQAVAVHGFRGMCGVCSLMCLSDRIKFRREPHGPDPSRLGSQLAQVPLPAGSAVQSAIVEGSGRPATTTVKWSAAREASFRRLEAVAPSTASASSSSCTSQSHQPFSASLRALAGAKDNFFAAGTLMVAPVAGLRASRSGVSCRVGTTRCRAAPP